MLMSELSASRLPVEPFALDGLTPAAALRPETVEQVAEAIALAHRERLAVVPWGGGTHQAAGNRLARYDLALSTAGLAGVLDHQPADLTLTVGAGTPLAAVQAHLAPYGQVLPLEAESPERATIGGLVSTATAGPLRLAAGAPRDQVLWVEAVQPDGTVVHGGAKVVKNVAGYDTPKLFVGSHGSVGVLTAVTLRVAPRPATAPTVLIGFETAAAAQDLAMALLASRLGPSLLTLVKRGPGWEAPYDAAWTLAVGADGAEATTRWQADQIEALARSGAGRTIRRLEGADSAEARRLLMARRGRGAVALKLALPPTQVVPALTLAAGLPDAGEWTAFAELANGVVRLEWAEPSEAWRAVAAHAEAAGHAWVLAHCPLDWKRPPLDVWGPERGDRFLMRRLKAALDPRGVLNPGRFVGG